MLNEEDFGMPYNIVFYFTDQQRWDTCGCFGQPLNITPNLDRLAQEGVKFDNAFSPQPVCGPCRALFQTGKYPTETGCFRNNIMLPGNIKTLANYIEDAGYETAYIGKWHLASDGELEKPPTIDHTITAIPRELRGGYTGFWRAADVLEFTSHGYDGFVFDENNNRIDFKGYRPDCITDLALEFFDAYDGKKPFFMTISQIEPHHQNDHNHYEGPIGSKEKYKNFVLPHDLEGKRVLVTAGPTQESIDPVRYLTNHSTGKMGYAIARMAMLRGAQVTLVSGPTALTPPPFVEVVPIVSAQDMFEAVTSRQEQSDLIFKAAAVADYTPLDYSDDKVKKKDGDLSIPLKRTQDILQYLGDHRRPGQVICGFSMETRDMLENSAAKLEKKHVDMICANNLKVEGAGFGVDTNVLTLITRDGAEELPLLSKEEAANRVIDRAVQIMG